MFSTQIEFFQESSIVHKDHEQSSRIPNKWSRPMNAYTKSEKPSSFPRDALEQAHVACRGWSEFAESLAVPNLSMETFVEKLHEAEAQVRRAEQLKEERARAIQERNETLSELWDLTKRIRNAAKATFGDNSAELELLVNLQREWT